MNKKISSIPCLRTAGTSFIGLVFVVFAAFLMVEGAEAFKQADVDKLKKTRQCPKCDLSGAIWIDGKKCKQGSIGECKK